jgi:hypothetical protein
LIFTVENRLRIITIFIDSIRFGYFDSRKKQTPTVLLQLDFKMKKVYSSFDSIMVNHLKNILASHHIDCMVKNEWLSGAAGELPPIECWPELWVKETQYEQAQTIITQMFEQQNEENTLLSWICSNCQEEIEGQFTACWQCGESRYK